MIKVDVNKTALQVWAVVYGVAALILMCIMVTPHKPHGNGGIAFRFWEVPLAILVGPYAIVGAVYGIAQLIKLGAPIKVQRLPRAHDPTLAELEAKSAELERKIGL